MPNAKRAILTAAVVALFSCVVGCQHGGRGGTGGEGTGGTIDDSGRMDQGYIINGTHDDPQPTVHTPHHRQ